MICPACQHPASDIARFCGHCGARLAPASGVEAGPQRAGRRQITVLFCDIAGSVALSERLDAEDYRALLAGYQDACASVVQRHEGRVENLVGDGIVVSFGLPNAREDDARRAIQTGLDIVAQAPEIGRRLGQNEAFAVRVGVHSGLAVIGEADPNSRRYQMGVVGSTANIAARLQALAQPNTVVISEHTAQLVQGLFLVEHLGKRKLRGLSRPTQVYRVVEPSPVRSIFEARIATGLSPLVGRQHELEQLRGAWLRARRGEGGIVLVRGEAGIGKSRLLHEFQRLAGDDAVQITFICDEQHRNSALFPAITELNRVFAIAPEDDRNRVFVKIRNHLDTLGISDPGVAEGIGMLLARPAADKQASGRPVQATSAERKRQTVRALRTMTSAVAKRSPLLLIFEDVHWADPSTLELLTDSAPWVASEPILILVSTRPDPPIAIAGATEIALSRLGRTDCVSLIESLSDRLLRSVPAVVQELVARSDGIPLFIEELTRSARSALAKPGAARAGAPVAPEVVPATLQDSLMARLDRLGAAKRAAQLAAAIGRRFERDILERIWDGAASDLEPSIARLSRAGLLFEDTGIGGKTIEFSHELVRQTAYQSLLRADRREIHRRIAEALAASPDGTASTYPELLAHHYTEAGLADQALPLWRSAAKLAIQKSANLEAVAHLQRALALLGTLPERADRRALELELQLGLAGPLMAAKGYGAPELRQAVQRAMALCRDAGTPPQIFPLMYGQWSYQQVTGQLRESLALARDFVQFAERQDDVAPRIIAYRLLGTSLQVTGEPVPALSYLHRACSLFDPERDAPLAYVYGTDLGVMTLCALAFTEWTLGRQASARRSSQSAWERALAVGHANTTGYCATFHTTIGLLCGEIDRATDAAAWTMRMATERNLPQWLATARSLHGWAQLQCGSLETAVTELRESIAEMRAVNLLYWQPVVWIFLGEALSRQGSAEEAQRAFEQSRALMQKTGERWAEAELYRCWANAWRRRGEEHARRAQRLFRMALKTASEQGALAWSLRARTDLAERAAASGNAAEARRILQPFLAEFPEPEESADFAAARAVLGRLDSATQPEPPRAVSVSERRASA